MSLQLKAFAKASAIALFMILGSTSVGLAGSSQDIHDKIENLLGNAGDFDTIFTQMKKVFKAGNIDDMMEIADTVEYPLPVNGGEGDIVINNRDEFIDQFDDIFPENVKSVIANQRYDKLGISSDGIMFGNGELWMNAICRDNACTDSYWAVTAINR